MVLFAEFADLSYGWMVAIGSIIGGIIAAGTGALVRILSAKSDIRRMERRDALSETIGIVDRLKKDVTVLGADLRVANGRIYELFEMESRCRVECSELKGQNKLLEQALRQIQVDSGHHSGSPVAPVYVMATTDGTILECSPSISALLHYLSTELVGKNVEILIPDRFRAAHNRGMKKVEEQGFDRWPGNAVVSFALTREGTEVPVTITLSAWRDGSQRWLIAAEIIHRTERPPITEGMIRPYHNQSSGDDDSIGGGR